MEYLFGFLGILCIAYFAGIAFYAGLSSRFPYIWLAGGGVFLTFFLIRTINWKLPAAAENAAMLISMILAAVLLLIGSFIVKSMKNKIQPDLDYVIVLGAQVKGKMPSQSLRYRIEKAQEYLEKNLKTKAVLSGGQGRGEEISEARCMYEYLVERGIHPERLLLEEDSVNTMQNIVFSKKKIKTEYPQGIETLRIGIVTNSFHVYRGAAIARKKLGCRVWEIPAKSNRFLLANYMLRECLGVLKDKAAGNL